MRQPDLCDGCLEPLTDGPPYLGVDVYEDPDDEDYDEDEDLVNDEDYTHRFHSWGCVWVFAGRQVAELPARPLD